MEKDCIFLLADKNMEYTFKGFLERTDFDQRLKTRPFTFEIIVDYKGNDPGVYNYSHELLRPFCRTHQYAVVALDLDWRGAPSTVNIQAKIKNDLTRNGWRVDNIEIIVIEPEVDVWLWTPTIAQALQLDLDLFISSKKRIEDRGLWQPTALKPARPKEAFDLLCWNIKRPRSSALYSRITKTISVSRCSDPAFCLLRDTLQRWFPNDGGQP